jgi:hypothetical protein
VKTTLSKKQPAASRPRRSIELDTHFFAAYRDLLKPESKKMPGSEKKMPRRPPYFDADGEPWAAPDCAGCGSEYVPGGGWGHRFIHCEVRLAAIAARHKAAKRKSKKRRRA